MEDKKPDPKDLKRWLKQHLLSSAEIDQKRRIALEKEVEERELRKWRNRDEED
jgi:hypothetical protein